MLQIIDCFIDYINVLCCICIFRLQNTKLSSEQKLEMAKSNYDKDISDYHHKLLKKEREVSLLQIAHERDKQVHFTFVNLHYYYHRVL